MTALRTDVPKEDFEDLRLAVVMNGGVSLAIWIGGVTHEINRLTQSEADDGSVYGALLGILRATARVDVIAGTSAGGVNGAFLALANVYRKDLNGLGRLWAQKGGFLDLFRPALEGNPPSLMRGDEYFLPALRDAFDTIAPLATRGAPQPARDVPVHLIITTTLMNGALKTFVDDFGNPISEVEHKGRFEFRRGRQIKEDPFAEPDITGKLALAARSTASFPIAFEPSFIPVNENGPDDLHPDMASAVRFRRSRYVLDGGVLVNKPVRPAIEAIYAQPAERQVRRVLAYVVPDPGNPTELPPDAVADLPGAARVLLDSLVSLPRAQSIAEDLAEIREQNKKVRAAQSLRPEVTPQLGPEFETLAPALFETYRVVRARRAVVNIASIVAARTQPPAEKGAPPAWTIDELLDAFGASGAALADSPVLPFVPATNTVTDRGDAPWDWGLAPAERLTRVALDVFRRALLVAPLDRSELRREIGQARLQLHDYINTLRQSRAQDDTFWGEQATVLGIPPSDPALRRDTIRTWARNALARWPVTKDADPSERDLTLLGLENTTDLIVLLLVDSGAILREAAATGEADGPSPDEARRLGELLDGLGLGTPPRRQSAARAAAARAALAKAVMRRVFAGEVALLALGIPSSDLEQAVELVQVSGDTPNAFGGPATVAKLAGVSMGHFGAFYKKSWRVSDWTWGRVDGATRMCQVLLSPKRLRQLQLPAADVLAAIRDAATGGPGAEQLTAMFAADEPKIAEELRFLDEDIPLPPSLPLTATVVARRIQSELLQDELRALAAAVHDDLDVGGSQGNGLSFARQYDNATSGGATLPPDRALAMFAAADIAAEATTETGSDLMAVTAGRALAVGVAAADAKGNGLGPVRVLARALRGVSLTAYGLVYAATRRSKFGTAASLAVLAAGGALLALSLLADVPGPLKAVATVLVLGAFVEALIRSRMWELGIAIAVPATAAFAVLLARDDLDALRENAGPIATVVGAVIGLMVLGSVRRPVDVPFLARWKHRRWVFWGGLVASTAALVWMESVEHGNILRLELLGWTRAWAGQILNDWGSLDLADDYLWRDFAYLATYWLPLMVAAGWAADRYAKRGHAGLARWGRSIAWLPLYAAVFDAVENGFLLREVAEAQENGPLGYAADGPAHLAPLATVAAWWKWLLVLGVLAYVIGSVAARRRQRPLTTAS